MYLVVYMKVILKHWALDFSGRGYMELLQTVLEAIFMYMFTH